MLRPSVRPSERKEVAADLTPELVAELGPGLSLRCAWSLCLQSCSTPAPLQLLRIVSISMASPHNHCGPAE